MVDDAKSGAEDSAASKQELSLEIHQESPQVIQTVLFPRGTEFTHEERDDLLDYYKLVAQNIDQISTKRQAVNSFFLSINSVIMAHHIPGFPGTVTAELTGGAVKMLPISNCMITTATVPPII